MRGKLKFLGLVTGLSWLLMPAVAGAVDAVMYEGTEKAFLLDEKGNPTLDVNKAVFRFGFASLEGTANFDSPFCAVLRAAQMLTGPTCAVTAFGSTMIGLQTGFGPVNADFETSINTDNPVDAPEVVLALGSITGTVFVDMPSAVALAALTRGHKAVIGPSIPILRMRGTYSAQGVGALSGISVPSDPSAPPLAFTATFRLPFAIDDEGIRTRPARGGKAFYLSDDGGKIRIDKNEFAFGFPMVRVEVTFDPTPK